MALRDRTKFDDPVLFYYPEEPAVTLVIHHGGFLSRGSKGVEYYGGKVSKFDYVDLNGIVLGSLDKLCEGLGYRGSKKYYKIENGKFVQLKGDREVLQLCLMHELDRSVSIFLQSLHQVDSDDDNYDVDAQSFEHEEFSDSDYSLGSDVPNECENNLLTSNIDDKAEWVEKIADPNIVDEEVSDDDVESVDNSLDFNSEKDSDSKQPEKYPVFSVKDMYDPKFYLGQWFDNKKEFKKVVDSYAVKNRRNIGFLKNDLRRIYAVCEEEGCSWRINALARSKGSKNNNISFQVAEFNNEHTCDGNYHVKNVKSSWLGEKYENHFRTDAKKKIKGWRDDIVTEMNVNVTENQAYRAKYVALKRIDGKSEDQYGKLWDYAEEIKNSNPGSTVVISCANEFGFDRPRFSKMYMCFKALKDAFLSGCRKLIGVDGCHLEGPHKGVLLTAVGVDPNNNPFPICYVVVGSETKQTWIWFLQLLKHDLNIVRDYEWTFISYKQKGLVPAFEHVFPTSHNRFCVRHLHSNMVNAGFRGSAFKKALWKCARASTVPEFGERMKHLYNLDPKAIEWLNDKPPHCWSKSHFTDDLKCDMLLNNICESFNSTILEARGKQIYSMFEKIREILMTKLRKCRDKAHKHWHGKLCPKIRKILAKIGEKTVECRPVKSSDTLYEINCIDGTRWKVDLRAHTCSCRKWELSGIPCKHAVSAINCQRLQPEDFVDKCYWVETYKTVYDHVLCPVNGPESWKSTGCIPPLPPNYGRAVGRLGGARRKEDGEVAAKRKKKLRNHNNLNRIKRHQTEYKCKSCGQVGHHRRGCPNKNERAKEPRVVQGNAATNESEPSFGEGNTATNTQDWGDELDWNQIDVEISSLEATGQLQSQLSEQINPTPQPSVVNVNIEKPKLTARKRTMDARVMTRSQQRKGMEKDTQHVAKKPFTAPRNSTQSGVNIRKVPFSPDHPRVAVSMTTQKREPLRGLKTFRKNGKKYVTCSNLEAALTARRIEKEKLRAKGKDKL